MADFWSGFAQGFTPAYQRSTDRRQLIEDRKLARTQGLEDAAAAELRAAKQKMVALGGGQGGAGWTQSDTRLLEVGTLHDVLARINQLEARNKRWAKDEAAKLLEDQRGHDKEVRDEIRQQKLVDIKTGIEREAEKKRTEQAAILESLTPLAKEAALGGRTLFTGKQPLPATSWKGQELGPDVLKGLPRGDVGQIGKYDALSPAQRQGAVLAGQRVEKEEIERKANLNPRWQPPAKPELSEQDMRNEILEWEGQLGITTGTKPSDGLQIRTGPQLRQYHGQLKRKVGDMEALRPKYQAPKSEDKGTQPERAAAEMKVLREEYNASGTTPERQGVLASEALGLLPLLYGQATQTHTIEDAEGYLQGKGLPPKITGSVRTKEPASPEALSKEETDHTNAARTMQRAKNIFMAKFGEKDAKKQLTIEGQLSHWIRNVAGAAAGLESWKDEEAAEFRAKADNLTAKALAQTHQMMGGGAFSEPDRILYERTIPTTKTFSPVNYMAKLKAWSEGLDDYVDYMTARQKIAELPRLVSEMEPWQVMKFTDKKDDDGNVIIGKGMAEMLIEYKLVLNPETNKTWTTQGLLDYQRENAQHGFTKQDMINFILMLPYEVKPPR